MEEFNRALALAMKAHKGQKRKTSKDPYVIHPIRVATKVLYETGDWHLTTVAVLHDVIEDSTYTYEDIKIEFGKKIADDVLELTDDLDLKAKLGKIDYWVTKWGSMGNRALTIKLYDRLDNIKDRPTERYLNKTIKALKRLDNSKFSAYTWSVYSELLRECNALLKELT